MTDAENFDDIRPYDDSEVREVLDRLISEKEFARVLLSMRFPRLLKFLPWPTVNIAQSKLKKLFQDIQTVKDFQLLVKRGLDRMLEQSDSRVTFSGFENLRAGESYLFLSNHRDIAMDPAFVNYVLNENDRETLRIAIGDNLLSKQFTSDLMRINKSFIVKRSITGRREKFAALKHLSTYIRKSIVEDGSCVWIAQREGRAKDGLDKTETALLKMLSLSKSKEQSFAESISELNLIPVSISYEYDPCDADKGRELYHNKYEGGYEKREHEDLISIYKGIVGHKGRVHLAFGEPIREGFEDDEQLADIIDRAVVSSYELQPPNILAYEKCEGADAYSAQMRANLGNIDWVEATRKFEERIGDIDPRFHEIVYDIYANPVRAKKSLN